MKQMFLLFPGDGAAAEVQHRRPRGAALRLVRVGACGRADSRKHAPHVPAQWQCVRDQVTAGKLLPQAGRKFLRISIGCEDFCD